MIKRMSMPPNIFRTVPAHGQTREAVEIFVIILYCEKEKKETKLHPSPIGYNP